MISPEYAERLVNAIREIFEELELILLRKIAERLGNDLYSPSWQELKLSDTQRLRIELEQIISEFSDEANDEAVNAISQAFRDGIDSANDDYREFLRGTGRGDILANVNANVPLSSINSVAVAAIASEAVGAMDNMRYHILRKSNDAYRQVITKASIVTMSGVETKPQAVQRAVNELADLGIGGFTDTRGRNWSASSYADMAVRTAVGRAALAGHETRLTELGEDLVIISQHPDECPKCRPHEGKIYSISGVSEKYPPLAQAKASGLFHPNCGHVATGYFEGFTEPMPKKIGSPTDYVQKQRQRAIERQIRRWKMREAVAITPDDKKRATVKVKEWQGVMRSFISDTGRRRNSKREQINFGKQ